MTTDRELLELAAKAAGIVGKWVDGFGSGDYYYQGNSSGIYYEHATGGYSVWNPLEDDGDALRLMVKLRIEVEPWIHGDSACSRAACGEVLIDEPHYGDDPERATRRAIVRAAAAIGSQS